MTELIFNFFQRMTAIAVEKVGANKVVYTSTGKVLLGQPRAVILRYQCFKFLV